MFCPQCGHKNKPNANFCRKCGNKLNIIPKDIGAVDFYGNKIESKKKVNNPVKKNNYSYENKSSKISGSIKPGLIKAYKLRQQDDGWGYAVAHVIPLVWIYYAISRKTITPFVYCFILSFICGIIFGEAWAISYLFIPFATKFAIRNAREYAKQKLKEKGISGDNSSNDFIGQKFCKNCGAAMNMNDIFCRSCGHKN